MTREHLVQPTRSGRYGMHGLLRAYARELLISQRGDQHQIAALASLFDHYVHAADTMASILFPAEHWPIAALRTPASIPPVTDPSGARAYLNAERHNLVAVVAHTAEHGWPGHTARLAAILCRHLEIEYAFEALAVPSQAARPAADRSARAEALVSLGGADFWPGRPEEAVSRLHDALALFRKAGDKQAAVHLRQALALFRASPPSRR